MLNPLHLQQVKLQAPVQIDLVYICLTEMEPHLKV